MHAIEVLQDVTAVVPCPRTHWVDNLRMTLTILLIVQHSITETAASALFPEFPSTPLTIFIFMCKNVLFGVFFVLSGYVASASMGKSSLSASTYYTSPRKRTNADILWRRTVRLFLPALAYAFIGHVAVWMFLSKTWPTFFGAQENIEDSKTPSIHGLARFEGPVVHLLFLYLLNVLHISLLPSQVPLVPKHPAASTTSTAPSKRPNLLVFARAGFRMESRRDYLILSFGCLCITVLGSTLVAMTTHTIHLTPRIGFNAASYDSIPASAPLHCTLAYFAGTKLKKWKKHILIPPPYIFPAFFLAISLSAATLYGGSLLLPALQHAIQINSPSHIHTSSIDGGLTASTIFVSIWTSASFFAIAVTLVSVFAQWKWTRRDWGPVARNTYVPVWIHMVPVVVFVRLLTADTPRSSVVDIATLLNLEDTHGGPSAGDRAAARLHLSQESVMWRCFLVGTGSVLCSWFVGLWVACLDWILQ